MTPAPVTQGNDVWYAERDMLPYCSPHGSAGLVAGVDYENTVTFTPGQLPVCDFKFRYPDKPAPGGVYGMLYLAKGNYAGGWVPEPVKPRMVREISKLYLDLETTYVGDPEAGDVLFEYWLGGDPMDGEPKRQKIEVGTFLGSPQATRRYHRRSAQLGRFQDCWGMDWDVAIDPGGAAKKFAMFMPADGRDHLNVKPDVLGQMHFLTRPHGAARRPIVMDYWWFRGCGLGVEPQRGSARMGIQKMDMVYA